MKGVSFRALCYIFAGLSVTPSAVLGLQLSIEHLREQIFDQGVVKGNFVQCSIQGSTHITGRGNYVFAPGKAFTFNFQHPRQYSIKYFSDGTEAKIVGGMEQERTRRSYQASLMFSILNMRSAALHRKFEANLSGSLANFDITLMPKKRLSKYLKFIKIAGKNGSVDSINLKFHSARSMTIFLLPLGKASNVSCG